MSGVLQRAWGRVFAAVYDRTMAAAEREGLGALRAELLAGARGRVLELGAGTGANLAHYPTGLDAVLLAEPEAPMARRLRPRAAGSGLPAEVLVAPAAALPVPDGSVDTVVCTLVLCTVPDVAAALAEVRRVLAPGGRLLFLEHVRHPDPRRARRQDIWNPIQRRVAHGCNVNRPTGELIAAARFALHDVRQEPFRKAPSVVQPLLRGSATP